MERSTDVNTDRAKGGKHVKAPARADLPAGVWTKTLMIRFSHCDPAGIVYFANYFDIANGLVEDWFIAELGLRHHDFVGPRRTGLGFASAHCDFVKPCRMGDQVTFAVQVQAVGTASISLVFFAYREDDLVLVMQLVMVTTSIAEERAIPIPNDLRSAIEAYKEKSR